MPPRNGVTLLTAALLDNHSSSGEQGPTAAKVWLCCFPQDRGGKQEGWKELGIRKSSTVLTLKYKYMQVNSALTCPTAAHLCSPWVTLGGLWLKVHKDTGYLKGTKCCLHFQSLLAFGSYQVRFLLPKSSMSRVSFYPNSDGVRGTESCRAHLQHTHVHTLNTHLTQPDWHF